jgi:hypothetical protein
VADLDGRKAALRREFSIEGEPCRSFQVIRLEPLSPLSPSKSVFRNVVVTAAVIQWFWPTCSIIGILVVWILAQSHIETLHARRADCNNLLSGSGILRASQYMCYSKSFSGDVRMDTAVMVQGALMTTNKHRVRTTIFKKKNRVKGVSKCCREFNNSTRQISSRQF